MTKKCKAPANQVRPGDITFTRPSRTKQAFHADVDLNQVIAKYHKTGILPQVNNNQPTYGDYSTPIDYHDAQNKIMLANNLFGDLPAHVRKTFDYDPAQFLEFAQNPENQEEMVKLGLAEPSSLPSRSIEPTGDPADEPGGDNASGDVSDNPTEA